MKVSLVVASGAHQGKVIQVTGAQFLIGRDAHCHLRPASQAVSKQHCALYVRDGQLFVKDFGSTNGTILNDGVVQNEERPLKNNDSLKVGPLDFTVRIDLTPAKADSTPLPETNAAGAAAMAAIKAVSAAALAAGGKGDRTPAPKTPSGASPSKPATATTVLPAHKAENTAAENDDKFAAMLLGLGEEDPPVVPEGSTVVDMQVVDQNAAAAGKEGDKKDPKKAQTREDMSNAANDLLRRYRQRPK